LKHQRRRAVICQVRGSWTKSGKRKKKEGREVGNWGGGIRWNRNTRAKPRKKEGLARDLKHNGRLKGRNRGEMR